jgi:hypothetical protein
MIRNANPETLLSWAGLLVHYGCCFEPPSGEDSKNLPWHNISYRRQPLLDLGAELTPLLAVEGILLDTLRANGHRIRLETSAIAHHVNISRWPSWIAHAYWGGRLFGAARAHRNRWSIWHRLVYIGGAPLIPLVRLRRILRLIGRTGRPGLFPRILPVLMSGLVPHACGELVGYAIGKGRAEERYTSYELARIRHVRAEERPLLME